MYRVVMLFAFMLAVSAAPDDGRRKCHRVHHGSMMHLNIERCCTGITTRVRNQKEDLQECFEKAKPGPPPPFSCEVDECIGKKFGYYGDDGFDKEAFTRFIEKKFENNEALVAAVKEKCLNDDISKHGPPDMCDIMKIKHCVDNQFLKICPEWSNEGACNGIQDLVAECAVHD